MAKDHLSGKLAVILHADVAGSTQRWFSKMSNWLTNASRMRFRRFSETIEKYQGRVSWSFAAMLYWLEFERASDAVTAATLAFQI